MNFSPSLKPLVLAMLSLCISSSAMAQDPSTAVSTQDTAGADIPAELDKVVITAGKRRERQRDVAGTVSALQGGQLEQRGAQDQEDVFKLAPGVQLNKGDPDRALPTMRGVGTVTSTSALATQQGTTGLYIEDVPFTDPWAFVGSADLAPFDLERVEVLRGPQGALYGSASLGGAVAYVLNKPNPKATEFSVLGTVNSTSSGGPGYSIYSMANLRSKAATSLLA